MILFVSLEHRYPDYMQHFRDSDSGVQTSSSRGIIIVMYILAVIVILLKGVWKVCKSYNLYTVALNFYNF